MMKRLLVGSVVLVAVWLAVHLVTGGRQADIPNIEQGIELWAESELGARGDVQADCPDPIEWEGGRNFHCILSDQTGTTRVTVTMENDDEVTWVLG